MVSFSMRFVSVEENARDIVHDVFMQIWESKIDISSIVNKKAYLYTLVRNKSLDFIRQSKVHDKYISIVGRDDVNDDDFFEQEVLREEMYRALDAVIDKLPERSRQILRLKLQGLKNAQIAEQLGISLNTVNAIKRSAYEKLRVFLGDKLNPIFFLVLFS